jgi:4-hydroxy-2-oxoheptanedioate aldolase
MGLRGAVDVPEWRVITLVAAGWLRGRGINFGRDQGQMNAIKDSIKAGKTVVGTAGAPNIDAALLADAGFDFLLFDTQHSPWEIKQMGPSIQAMRGKKAAPLVRVAANQADQICFALDAGARGIVVPMVNTRAEAEAVVRACRYYPAGNRSNAGERGEWGAFKSYREYMDTVNNELVIVPMIETKQALENLDAIASVPGVDVLLIGPSDLSIELDVPLDYACDTYLRALDKIAAAAAKHGIAAGMYFIPPGMEPNFFVDRGFKFFTMPWGPWATAGIQNALAGIKR